MKHVLILTGLFLTYFSSGISQGTAVYTYVAADYPTSDCNKAATQIGERFHQLTHLEIYQVRGIPTNPLCTIEVSYLADRRAEVTSTFMERFYHNQGAYSSMSACNATLTHEVSTFTSETGLTPVVAYCLRDDMDRGGLPYAIKIDGIGTPKNTFIYSSSLLAGPPLVSPTQLSAEIAKNAQAQNFSLVTATIDRTVTDFYRLGLRFYAKSYILINVPSFRFLTAGHCKESLPQIEEALKKGKERTLGSFCVDKTEFNRYFNLHTIIVGETGKVKNFVAPDVFADYRDCQNDRPRIEKFFRDRGTTIYGSACILSADGYKAVLFSGR